MADEYQVEYEYVNGSSIEFKTNDLKITPVRSHLKVDTRVDGTRVVTDPGYVHRKFTFSAVISGATMNTLHDIQVAAIVYTGAYPRITKIYWNGATTETNIEVALTDLTTLDLGAGWWLVNITMEEKDQ